MTAARAPSERDVSQMTTVDEITDRRAALIAGLRDLADWFEANPDVPVGPHPYLEYKHFPRGDDEAEFAEVVRVAELIGEDVHTNASADRHFVVKQFGPVAYEVLAISARAMARHEAVFSYYGRVEPETAGAR